MKRRSIGARHEMIVQPAFIIGTYNEDKTPDFAPITWVSKTCEQGDDCLIVISMYGTKKTKQNVQRTKQFSINLVSTGMLPLMDYFGQTSGHGGVKNELAYTYGRAVCVDAPTLDESRWVCECEVQSTVATGESDTFFCRIKNVQIDERIDVDTKGVDLTLFDPVIYSGNYHSIGEYLGAIGDYYHKPETKQAMNTQEQLAEKLNISPQAVSKWENGKAVPEVPMLCEMSKLFDCSVDRILDPSARVLRNMGFDYEFLVKPRIAVADPSGSEWPKSISSAALLTAVKLFFGLEPRRDIKNRQINDDEEYILQSAITNICFGYSYAPDEWIHDSFLIYGLDYEVYAKADHSEDEWIAFACRQIEHGYPVIIIPKEYTDTVFAIGFSGHGQILKGLGFLDGDDQKNAMINFDWLNQYAGWYKDDCHMLIVKPVKEKMPLEKACVHALHRGVTMLCNNDHCGEDKMQGYGLVIYRNWCDLLREENQRNAEQIECVFPHAFIHYENKLRTKQFFELCINTIPGIDKELMSLAITQYSDIVSLATEIATIAHQRDSFAVDDLKEKRNHIIELLRRSSEQEELALSYIQKATANISEI